MNFKQNYNFYHDAGHGWVAVPEEEVEELGVKVSRYSYIFSGILFLEEDVDAPAFLTAYKKRTGHNAYLNEIGHGDNSVIRTYNHYNIV